MDQLKRFLPAMLGLACGRAGLIAVTYGSYANTDENVLTDGPTLIALGFLIAGLIALVVGKGRLSERTVDGACIVTIVVEAATAFGLAYLTFASPDCFEALLALSAICTLAGYLCIFYWLRCMCASSATDAAMFSFGALVASEVVLFVIASAPDEIEKIAAGILVLCQFACFAWRKSCKDGVVQGTEDADAQQELLYHGFGSASVNKTHYLVAMAFGVGALSIVIGVLRGYPDGSAIPFTPPTRLAYGALTIVVSLGIIKLLREGRQGAVSVGIFTVMEALACIALILYAAFPDDLAIGAVSTTTLNALMVGFTWYIVIVFMAHGWRDPYYYAFGGWIVWLGCRAIARIGLLELHLVSANNLLVTAVLGSLVVFSTQVVLIRLLAVSNEALDRSEEKNGLAADVQPEELPKSSMIERIMGLDEGPVPIEPMSLSDMRKQAMRRHAEEMGQQFLLSAREVDVLALYALGYTQKRVAEELFISQSTAHAHIKRIYAKTDMHSRQELIDYLNTYT